MDRGPECDSVRQSTVSWFISAGSAMTVTGELFDGDDIASSRMMLSVMWALMVYGGVVFSLLCL